MKTENKDTLKKFKDLAIALYAEFGLELTTDAQESLDRMDEEIATIKHYAKIGEAAEEAFDYFSMGAPDEDGNCTSFDILDTEMLLKWHDEVKKIRRKRGK